MTSSNLFHGSWTPEALREVFDRHPARPLLPPLGDPEWKRTAENRYIRQLAGPLHAMAEAECDEPLPVLTDELYASFKKTGVRLTFERVYFERRRRLARVALSLALGPWEGEQRARRVESVLSKFRDIFEEVSWALPAHVNWHNDDPSGKEPLRIDLFCAETANFMAEMLDIFSEIIPPDLRQSVRSRLRTAVFENYLRTDLHWMDVTHNWNAVCHQGVVGAALSQLDDPDLLAAIVGKMRQKLAHFLEGYGPDGGCSEGPGYWNYGFGWFAALNEQLEKRTGGELSLFVGDSLVRAIALYGPRMSLAGDHVVNFADGPSSGAFNPWLFVYLGKRLGEEGCLPAGFEGYRRIVAKGLDSSALRADVFNLSRQLLKFPEELPAAANPPADCFLPDLAIVVARGGDAKGHLWEFAAKAGHNGEHHNHNDCGSYLVNVDARRVIAEIGAPEYVHDFFLPEKRYQFLAARSLGHSVPIVNGCEQSAGQDFASKVLAADVGSDRVEFVMDLTGCYPEAAGCRRLIRTFVFEKSAGRIVVTDDFELAAPGTVESLVICLDEIVSEGGDLLIVPGPPVLRIRPGAGLKLLSNELCPYRGHRGEDEQVRRLKFRLEGDPVASGRNEIEFTCA